MSRIEIKNGYKWLVEGRPGFEIFHQLEKVEDEKPVIVEEKPKKKKKKKEDVN